MTLSETPREPIPMTGGAPSGELLVSVTEAAAKKVLELRSREGKADARLRLFVKSGGCSGFSYGLAFDEKMNDGDTVEDHAGVPDHHRPVQPAACRRRRDRLRRFAHGLRLRHQQPERGEQLRLRLLVQHRWVTGKGRRLRALDTLLRDRSPGTSPGLRRAG